MGGKSLAVLSVVGEALNFASRRFETVLRVSFVPIALLLILNMAAVFAYLSIANAGLLTFGDVAAAGVSWAQVVQLANQVATKGLGEFSAPVWTVYLAKLGATLVLVASFMAPLIRYAGLGERPAPGLLRVPFGAAQIRFILASALSFILAAIVVYAPVSVATLYVIGVISRAMMTPYAHFPDTQSLHTVDLLPGSEALAMRGELWIYEYGYWGAAALVTAALLAIMLILHVRPRDEDRTAGIGVLGRTIGVVSGLLLYFGVVAFAVTQIAALNKTAMSAQTLSMLMFVAAASAVALFFNLRLYPYAGVAVCRAGIGFGGTFRVTRRFDVVRLALAALLLGLILGGVWLLLTYIAWDGTLAVLIYVAAAVDSFVRIGGGDSAWVLPFFGWLWAVINICFAILWTAFTYGVSAGLWGRLYRESER